jgi:hypothetical protein
MYYFAIYSDKRLARFNHSEKVNVVNQAIKLYRQEHPLNLVKRLLVLFAFCGMPAVLILLTVNGGFAMAWLSVSVFLINIKIMADERSKIKAYIGQAIG